MLNYTMYHRKAFICVCVRVLECSCDPAGAKEVPGYPLGGCGAYTDGQLCECKERVAGRICDTCKPGYWNLRIHNPDGCEGNTPTGDIQ